jgi:signal transduction histidine kinase
MARTPAAPRAAPPTQRGGSLGASIRAWMLVVGLLPLAALFLSGYFSSRAALVEASDDHLVSVVEARRARIEAWLQERTTDLDVISGSQDCILLVHQAVSHETHADVCRYLGSFQTGARDYRTLALYDLRWNWVASSTGTHEPLDEARKTWLERELSARSGPVMGPVRIGPDGPTLAVANGLWTPEGKMVGYVVATLDLRASLAPVLMNRAGLKHTGRVLLADSTGTVFLTSGPKTAAGASNLPPAVAADAARQGVGNTHFRSTDGSVFSGFTHVVGPGWLLVAEMDQTEALGLLHSLRRAFLIAGLLTVVAVIILSSRISKRLSTPLAELAGAARRIKEGRHGERVPEFAGREVGDVGRAFNEMLEALEEIQRQRIQASTLAAVGELSSSVVHEIRNRLSSVKMNVQALERRVGDDETFSELARIAVDQVRRVEEMLSELLNYARPVSPAFEPVRAADVLDAIAGVFKAEAAARGVRLTVEDRTAGAVLPLDRKLLEQALSNLIRNALEASPEGGTVTLRVVHDPPPHGGIVLEVQDEGPGFDGIPPEDLFKPFFTTKETGTGLGLAHARKITELHGGRIQAGRTERGGAIFRLEFPEPGGSR